MSKWETDAGGWREGRRRAFCWETDAGAWQEGRQQEGVLVGDGWKLPAIVARTTLGQEGTGGAKRTLGYEFGRLRASANGAAWQEDDDLIPLIYTRIFMIITTKTGNREAGGSSPPGGA